MANPQTYVFSTGATSVPDVGLLEYNGCTFGPLFETKISGKIVHDEANRTTKFMEYTLEADGYVTLPAGPAAADINPCMSVLRSLLTQQAGALTYRGRGFDLVVNAGGGGVVRAGAVLTGPAVKIAGWDVAWGPVPEIIEFQPLGAGNSAKVQWKVVVRIPEVAQKGAGLLQFNYETTVSYGEDGFSTLSMRGVLEVAMTRGGVKNRSVNLTADDYRNRLTPLILDGIDLSIFRVMRREFSVSRDKRTLTWDVAAEERPHMDPPVDCTVARGSYSVKPAKSGMGLVLWLCTLKATYTVRPGAPRRTAWYAFLAMLRLRMNQSRFGVLAGLTEPEPAKKAGFLKRFGVGAGGALIGYLGSGGPFNPAAPYIAFGTAAGALALINSDTPAKGGTEHAGRKCWLIDFSIDEGLYLDSKTISFSATWRLQTLISHILLASGIWTKVPEKDANRNNLWAMSMKNISGAESWLENRLDPNLDVIVDFGGP